MRLHYMASSDMLFANSARISEGSWRLKLRGCANGEADPGRRKLSCYPRY